MRVFLKPTRDLRGIYFNYKFGALYVVIPDRWMMTIACFILCSSSTYVC